MDTLLFARRIFAFCAPQIIWCAVIFAAALVGTALSAFGCGASTRVAVRNETSEPVTVALRSPESQESMRFSDLPPRGASPLQPLTFGALNIIVEVRSEVGKSGRVRLSRGEDNIVVVKAEEPPEVLVPGKRRAAKSTQSVQPAPATALPKPVDPPDQPPSPNPEEEPALEPIIDL